MVNEQDIKVVTAPETGAAKEGESLDGGEAGVSTGSLFDETAAGGAAEPTKPYKLNSGKDSFKGMLILVGWALVIIFAALLLFRSTIERAGSMFTVHFLG